MQSNSVNTILLIPNILDNNTRTGTTKGLLSGDDTFKNMLSEKISERKNHSSQPQHIDRKMHLTKSRELNEVANPVNNADAEAEPDAKKLNDRPENTVAATTSTSEPEDIKIDEKEIRKEISSLEALIALLEELMARLSLKTVSAVPEKSDASQELTLFDENKPISPMELLMALVKEDAVKLEAIINESGDSINTPQINELLEKIQTLLKKFADDKNVPLLKAEIEGESAGVEELIQQLKSQCRQLIDKLNEQVSGLDAALSEESVQQEQIVSESIKAEPEAQHETKDAEDHFSALADDADASTVKTDAEIDNYFENIIVQSRHMPEESQVRPEVAEKTQLPLSQKPVANTVTNQVAMKVKLMAGENKQEMEMHLKPDSLGKLSLKIIHERGEILARFTAENQQVKAILESNMQMLKDALEKSGLNVQNLSVSVGTGKESGQNNNSRDDKGKVDSVGLRRMTGTSSNTDTDKLHLRARIEKEYFDDTSQINLTA